MKGPKLNLKSGASHLIANASRPNRSLRFQWVKPRSFATSYSPRAPILVDNPTCPPEWMAGPASLPLLVLTVWFQPSALSKFFSFPISFRLMIQRLRKKNLWPRHTLHSSQTHFLKLYSPASLVRGCLAYA